MFWKCMCVCVSHFARLRLTAKKQSLLTEYQMKWRTKSSREDNSSRKFEKLLLTYLALLDLRFFKNVNLEKDINT